MFFLPALFTGIAAVSSFWLGHGVNPMLSVFTLVWLMLGWAIARAITRNMRRAPSGRKS